MIDDDEDDDHAQNDEVLALSAIFSEDFSATRSIAGTFVGSLSVQVSNARGFLMQLQPIAVPARSVASNSDTGATIDSDLDSGGTEQPSPIPSVASATVLSIDGDGQVSWRPPATPVLPTAAPTQVPNAIPRQQVPVKLENLPPIRIRFVLPPSYPSDAPPEISLDCIWLSPEQLRRLKIHLLSLWKNDAVLFLMADFLKEEAADFLHVFDDALNTDAPLLNLLADKGDGFWKPARVREAIEACLEFDRSESLRLFNLSSLRCQICLEEVKGVHCVRFAPCKHSICRSCAKGFFTLMILEGNLVQVNCPDEGCKKEKSRPPLPEETIEAIVGPEMLKRYKEVAEKQQHMQHPGSTLCPRPHCSAYVIKDPGEEKLCICNKCGFAFCFFCHRAWHGSVQYCRIPHVTELANKYINADPEEKRILEIKYGKRTLEKVVRDLEENRLTHEWISNNSQRCPSCNVAVERSFGCSHMTCTICQTHFCYLCSSHLSKDDPYKHFSDRRSPCYQRLFEGAVPEGGGDGEELDVDLIMDEFLDGL